MTMAVRPSGCRSEIRVEEYGRKRHLRHAQERDFWKEIYERKLLAAAEFGQIYPDTAIQIE